MSCHVIVHNVHAALLISQPACLPIHQPTKQTNTCIYERYLGGSFFWREKAEAEAKAEGRDDAQESTSQKNKLS